MKTICHYKDKTIRIYALFFLFLHCFFYFYCYDHHPSFRFSN